MIQHRTRKWRSRKRLSTFKTKIRLIQCRQRRRRRQQQRRWRRQQKTSHMIWAITSKSRWQSGKEKKRVDIRTYENDRPTIKGVSLTIENMMALKKHLTELHRDLQELVCKATPVNKRIDIGNSLFVTINSEFRCINIRRWFKPQNMDQLLPSKKGIALNLSQFSALKNILNALPCLHGDDIYSVFNCNKCSPYNMIDV